MINSLRTRFTAFLLLVALIPIGLLYFYNLYASDEVKDEFAKELLDTAYLINTEINRFIADRVKVLEVTASSLASKEDKYSNLDPLPIPEFTAKTRSKWTFII